MLMGKCHEFVGLRLACGDGLFNQQVDAGAQERCSDSVVRRSRYANRSGVQHQLAAMARSEHILKRGIHRNAPLTAQGLRTRAVRFEDGGKLDDAGCLFQFAIDTKMIAPEGSRAADRDTKRGWTTGHYRTRSSGSARKAPAGGRRVLQAWKRAKL